MNSYRHARPPLRKRLWPVAVLLVIAVAHTAACWQLLGGWTGFTSPYPILVHDYPIHYYYSVIARNFLRESGTTAGYDPNFMAGYAKSIIYPSSTTLPEVIHSVFGFESLEENARLFKVYVFASIAVLPWLMWLASRIWLGNMDRDDPYESAGSPSLSGESAGEGQRWSAWPIVWALVLYELYFWTEGYIHYVRFGMVPFVLSGPLAVVSAGWVVRFLQRGGAARWWAAALWSGVACLTHVSSAFALLPALLVAYLLSWRRMGWRRHGATWLMPFVVLAINAFWIVPGVLLWSTKGTTATGIGFINPNVWDRFLEFVTVQPRILLTTLLLAPVGLVLWRGGSRAAFWAMTTLLVWTFFLGYLAGLERGLDFLQPGRYTLYFFTWGTIPAGVAASGLVRWVGRNTPSWVLRAVFAALAVAGTAFLYGPDTNTAVSPLFDRRGPRTPLITDLPPLHRQLFDRLKELTRPGDRILFEEINRVTSRPSPHGPDPWEAIRLAPLVPLYTEREVIGGPYLYTHLKTNFTQFGDGKFLGRTKWTTADFERYVRLYAVKWIVCRLDKTKYFCQKNPHLVEVVDDLQGAYLIGRIVIDIPEQPVPGIRTLPGRAQVTSRPGRLVVRPLGTDNGLLVLPYHWAPRLTADPPAIVEPYVLLDDPVPFISLRDPPPDVELRIQGFW